MIEIEKLNKTYLKHTKHAQKVLFDLSLKLPEKGFVCILGPSGCGKTSFLNAVGGLDEYDSGRITVDSVSFKENSSKAFSEIKNKHFGYIFQNYYLLPKHSVGYNVYLGLHSLKISHEEKLKRVVSALKATGMERYIRRNVSDLSGGQQQRVAIARAVARKPRVIFADEPTGNLDENNTYNICSLLKSISKESLVLMVTHEERIAEFFADRVIRLENGKIISDSEGAKKSEYSFTDSSKIYTDDFKEETYRNENTKLRVLKDDVNKSLNLTLVMVGDKLIIKAENKNIAEITNLNEPPFITEGKKPVISNTEIQENTHLSYIEDNEKIETKAGIGIKFKDIFKEALHINKASNLKLIGTRIFLILLTLLTLITAGDFLTLSKVDPEDFIEADSHLLNITVERGEGMPTNVISIEGYIDRLLLSLEESQLQYECLPVINRDTTLYSNLFLQTGKLTTRISGFSYIPLDYLDEGDIIYGRMPEKADEIIIDRWVLENFMAEDGIMQNGFTSVDQFLGKEIIYSKRVLTPTIVGISDSGEPSVYIDRELLASVCVRSTEVASLSKLQKAFQNEFDGVTLNKDECIVITQNAGEAYKNRLGSSYNTNGFLSFVIKDTSDVKGFYPKIVVADSEIETILNNLVSENFFIYTNDKTAVKNYLNSTALVNDKLLKIEVRDIYEETLSRYIEASRLKMDARFIVTMSVMLVSLLMLYLLRLSQIEGEIIMLSVYRLLGIPKRKLCSIFIVDSLFNTLITALPTAILTFLTVYLLNALPSINLNFVLTFPVSLLIYILISLFHILVTFIPLIRLLRLPPAQLASKYDI